MENLSKVTPIRTEDLLSDKEMVFDILIKEKIIDVFISDLEDVGFEDIEIDEFIVKLRNLSENSIKGVLSIPQELRRKNFRLYKEKLSSGKISIDNIVAEFNKNAQENDYTLGYHVSKTDIPEERGKWEIKATEFDDRDDRNMAYYSLDYKNLYRIDRGTKLYVIRAKTGENSSHKLDNKSNWGRAGTLSIVCKIDLSQLDLEMEEKIRELKEKRLRSAA